MKKQKINWTSSLNHSKRSINYMHKSKTRIRHWLEIPYLITSLIILFGVGWYFYDLKPQYTILFILIGLIIIRIREGQQLGNSLRVSKRHFFRIKQIVEAQAKALNVREPRLFIYQDPYPEAYTYGFVSPYTIVISSALVELLTEDELEAVIAHEMGHIKYSHAQILAIINPVGTEVPILSWIFLFWSRAAEITCDNTSLHVTGNPRALITSLIKLHVGPKFMSQIDEDDIIGQSKDVSRNYLNKIGELLNTHPYLTSRVNNIISHSNASGIPYTKSGKIKCSACGNEASLSAQFCPNCGNKIQAI